MMQARSISKKWSKSCEIKIQIELKVISVAIFKFENKVNRGHIWNQGQISRQGQLRSRSTEVEVKRGQGQTKWKALLV